MSDCVISVKNVSKLYQLGERRLRYKTLRDAITESVARGFRSAHVEKDKQVLWALQDVSFDVHPGEVVGLIGRNGAGKSTMLKILSEITYPTAGRVDIHGRVASLLEVGTGFHPELTGRENIFLNGAILGMTRAEIKSKFNEIVAFAEVEDFIDTPVKRYSSGMYVRLAFAVAAHLEPEILLVDEVLAVGDVQFQRKCMGKMSDVARGDGRTIIFVSHNMAAIESLCSRAILLDQGSVLVSGKPDDVISSYLGQYGASSGEADLTTHPGRTSTGEAVLTSWRITNAGGAVTSCIPIGEDVTFEVHGRTQQPISSAALGIRILSLTGQRIATCHTDYQYGEKISLNGDFALRCTLRQCRLAAGPYSITLVLRGDQQVADQVENLSFEVAPKDVYGTGKVLPPFAGHYIPEIQWQINPPPL